MSKPPRRIAPLLPIVQVDWEDSTSQSPWGEVSEHLQHGALMCQTFGYLLKRTKQALVVVQNAALITTDELHHVSNSMTIPMGCVKRVTYLR